MKGSWSIKRVLPCLVPDLHYSDLGDVQDGLMAQSAYLDITAGHSTIEHTEALCTDLRRYCALDTYAMVAIVARLVEPSRHRAASSGLKSFGKKELSGS